MEKTKAAGGVLGLLLGILHNAPDSVTLLAIAFGVLFVLDTLTGIGAAWLEGDLDSGRGRQMILAKVLQYFTLFAIAVCSSVFLSGLLGNPTWWTYTGIVSLMCVQEMQSILENLIRLEKYGVSMGPFKPILEKVKGGFAVSQSTGAEKKEGA